MKSIVAFLQNPWFKPGTHPRNIKLFQENQEFRKRAICLSRTGKLLFAAFGAELYHHIWWDEANPEPAFNSREVKPPDVPHIISILQLRRPAVILAFGKSAFGGVRAAAIQEFDFNAVILPCGHPTARGIHRPNLSAFATRVRFAATEIDAPV